MTHCFQLGKGADQMLKIIWNDKETCEFPHIFLRDNCQCPACFHPVAKSRLVDTVKAIDRYSTDRNQM